MKNDFEQNNDETMNGTSFGQNHDMTQMGYTQPQSMPVYAQPEEPSVQMEHMQSQQPQMGNPQMRDSQIPQTENSQMRNPQMDNPQMGYSNHPQMNYSGNSRMEHTSMSNPQMYTQNVHANIKQDVYPDMPHMNPYNLSSMQKIVEQEQEKKIKKSKKRKKNGKVLRFFKKGVAVVAAAAVFGSVSGGVFYLVTDKQIEKIDELKEQQETAKTTLHTVDSISVPTSTSVSGGMDVSAIADSVMPSVVAINISAVVERQDWFGFVQKYESEGSGSGIIVGQNNSELLIVTNNHVVSDATEVYVSFIDGESYEAKVKGTDNDNDLAIIVVNLKDISDSTMNQIKVATIGDSDSVKVGEQVVAIGNALGYGQSVTTGIVSAKDRTNDTNSTPLIQTDAAINPGNSGGALLNMKGEVIGINSSKYADTTVEGMGYAIPITAVSEQLDNLMNLKTREKVDEDKRGYLGISCGSITQEASEMYGIPQGVIVTEVNEGSGAQKAGIKKNYIITKIDGQSVSSAEDLTSKLGYYKAGEKVSITYQYLDDDEYQEKTVDVTLGENPNKSEK